MDDGGVSLSLWLEVDVEVKVEDDELVEVTRLSRREMAAGRAEDDFDDSTLISASLYSSQSFSTSLKLSGFLLSNLAARVSKQ